ncbi:MAG: acetolactate synthase small subunit [Oscillospiraceae bacterium]
MERYTLSMLVKNHSGVLSRVSGLFSRRGYNIESLSVGVTENENISRITIVVLGDQYVVEQITKQLNKLIDVIKIGVLEGDGAVCRGLMLVKVTATEQTRTAVLQIVDIFRAKVIDICATSLIVEMTGDKSKQQALLDMLEPFGILEISKTGLAGLQRGEVQLKNC